MTGQTCDGWTRCSAPGCRTRLRAGVGLCAPHAEHERARGHQFEREPPPLPDAGPVELMVYRATESPWQRCRHCGGRQLAHHPIAPSQER